MTSNVKMRLRSSTSGVVASTKGATLSGERPNDTQQRQRFHLSCFNTRLLDEDKRRVYSQEGRLRRNGHNTLRQDGRQANTDHEAAVLDVVLCTGFVFCRRFEGEGEAKVEAVRLRDALNEDQH